MDEDDTGLLAQVLEHYDITPRNGMTRCPLPGHGERVASLSVNTGKGAWKCHGCGKQGYAAQFVMEMEDLDYRQARDWIAATLPDAAGASAGGLRTLRAGQQRRDDDLPWSAGTDTGGRDWTPPWAGG